MLTRLVFAAAAALLSFPVLAQEYPTGPVTIVVPFPPGGAGDVTGRLLADQLGTTLNQTFVVDNKPGANTAIGINSLVQSQGDGHTIGIVSSSLPILDLIQSDFTVDYEEGFKPVAMLNRGTLVLVVRSDLPVETFGEFIALAKEKPGELDAAGAGGATDRLALEMLHSVADIETLYVPYQGGAAGLTAMLNGEAAFGLFPIVTVGPHVETGALRPLAVTMSTRSPLLPDVPTIAESGYPEYDMSYWFGVIAPASTPDDLVVKINELITTATAS
ncbi:MAG: tripartite tricarboxylate transporter substrate binding protein, partial [Phyllobacteriaceae bacterium]|nr:tripartite tricarboxylate transporter substrate binding protein [Phyllobacteriaceae bacterium]